MTTSLTTPLITPRRRSRGLSCSLLASLWLCACATGQTAPSRALPMPEPLEARTALLQDIGRRAFSALQHGTPHALLLDDTALRALLLPEPANQAAALRASTELAMQVSPDTRTTLAHAHYRGVCVQGAREVPAGGSPGLRAAGFMFDRALVVGSELDGGRVAAWVEGTFLLTDQGFYAVALQRLETPRRDHADLDLAQCDLEVGVRSARPVLVLGSGAP